MRAVMLGAVVVGLLGSPVGGRAADDNKDAIIGLWELVHQDHTDRAPGWARCGYEWFVPLLGRLAV